MLERAGIMSGRIVPWFAKHGVGLASALALALAVAHPGPVSAATSFTDLNPNGSLGSGQFTVYFVDNYGTKYYYLPQEQFTAGVSVALTEIDVGLNVSYGLAGSVYAILYSSVGNTVGSVLGSWKLTTPAIMGTYLATATGITGINLVAGTSYFLGIQAGSDQGSGDLFLVSNDQAVSGILYERIGSSSTETNYGQVTLSAFDLIGNGTSVPEPASLAILGFGIGVLAAARRYAARRPD